jgi:hypothetical protein
MYPHRKKFKGIKSGDLGGQAIGHPVLIHFSGNCFHWVGVGMMGRGERKLGNFLHLLV